MKSKIALITGASSGMGKEFTKLHASNGDDLILVARNKVQLEKLKEDLERKYEIQVQVFDKDLAEKDAAREIYMAMKERNIKVDFLINNAGFGGRGNFHETPISADIQMIRVNLLTVTKLTKLFLSDFVERGSGKILNVSSTGALVPGPLQAVYCATKAYVASFSNGIARELKGTGVTVTNLMPGATDTGFARTAGMQNTPLFKKAVSPEKVAKAGYTGMMKGKLNVITGVTLSQRITLALALLFPKQLLLDQIYQMQTEK